MVPERAAGRQDQAPGRVAADLASLESGARSARWLARNWPSVTYLRIDRAASHACKSRAVWMPWHACTSSQQASCCE